MSKRRLILIAVFVLSMGVLVYRTVQVFSSMSTTPVPKPAAQLRKIVDEEFESAARPLSEVLDLDFEGNGQNYIRFYDIVRSRLRHRQFTDLDMYASEVRTSQARLPDGVWRLERFYDQLSVPAASSNASDEAWQAHFKLLEEWMESSPASSTARVAYADAWSAYAWKVRGDGFAREVDPDAWEPFHSRLRKAEQSLIGASSISATCPQWYAVMMEIAIATGWKRNDFEALFERAIAFEPRYFAFYNQKARYLLPRWNGEEGEWEEYMEETMDEVGGEEGGALFYLMFMSDWFSDEELPPVIRRFWPRLKKGYADLHKLYGSSGAARNKHFKYAYTARDADEARAIFNRIGDQWFPTMWTSAENLDRAKKWLADQTADAQPPPRSPR